MSIVESTVKKFNPDIFVICSAESNGFDPKLTRELRDTDGEYYKFAGDCALIYPIVEMCGPKHLKFINKVIYI